MHQYTFTVFIPAYNRARTLPRLFESLNAQTYKDFEVIVVDDGSQDETRDVIADHRGKVFFPLRYYYQKNQGKHVARNTALDLATGELFFTVDSDDVLVHTALERMYHHWIQRMTSGEMDDVIGVEGLCADLETRQIIGSRFPSEGYVTDHVTSRYRDGMFGDKPRCIKTSVFRRFKFPVISGERFIAEGIVWNRLALAGYRFIYVNEIITLVDYQSDGLSATSRQIRATNPLGARLHYEEFISRVAPRFGLRGKAVLRGAANWVRYGLHARDLSYQGLRRLVPLGYRLSALLIGTWLYTGDKRNIAKWGAK